MAKRLILLYLLLCISFPLQAGIRDKIIRVVASKPAAVVPQATIQAGNAVLNATTNSAANAALGQISPITLPQIGNIGEVPPIPNKGVSSLRMYNILKDQADQTYQEAIRLKSTLNNPGIMGEPVKSSGIARFLTRAKELYPDKPFLHKGLLSPVLTHLYFLAESNRLYIQHLRQAQEFWPVFNEAIPRFYEEAESIVQPEETQEAMVQWAAAQIPANVKVLGIGEWHGYREIPTFLADLLEKIDAQMEEQGRKVILFTEFLVNPNTSGPLFGGFVNCPYGHYYRAVWNRARHLDIKVVGLEDQYVRSNLSNVQGYGGENSTFTLRRWAAMDGVRIRNEHWSTLLQKYREENPDALFIIYAGAGHLLYNHPFSLLAQFNKEETFMLNLVPDEAYEGGQMFHGTDPLEELNPNLSFPQPVIKWQSPDLAQLSGYDARVRLPIDIKAKKQDMANFGQLGGLPIGWPNEWPQEGVNQYPR